MGDEALKLTPRQAAFVKEYLVDLNATRAAKEAGYSAKTAHSAGPRLLAHVDVAAAIKSALDKRAAKLELTADGVLRDLVRLSEAAEQAKDWGPAIKARELLGKHLKLFTDKVEHSGDQAITVVVQSLAEPKKGKKP